MTTHRTTSKAARSVLEVLNGPVLAKVILALAVGLTFFYWWSADQAVEDLAAERFEDRTAAIQDAIAERQTDYEAVLWAGVGLFNASDEVDREEWRAFTSALALEENRPGIQGFGYAVPVEAGSVDEHVASIRAEGFPDYTIKPDGVRDEYSAIVFLEPFDWRNQRAFGFDMWSNDVRREAMTRARDTGEAATSGAITLVQETDDDVQRGFLTYVPVYENGVSPTSIDDRRAAFEGWVYAPFRMGDLMDGILGSDVDDLSFEIFDGGDVSEEGLLFDSDDRFVGSAITPGSPFRRELDIVSQGRPWTIVFEANEGFISASDARQPALIALAALIIEVLLFFVISSLSLVQKRASALAEERTAALSDATAELETRAGELQATNDELEQFIFSAAHDLQAPIRTISSYALLIEDDPDTELSADTRDTVDRIVDSAGRMNQLLNDLLRYARIGWDTQPEAVDLNQVAAEVIDDVIGPGIDDVDVEIAALPIVAGHPTHLRLLLQNLVENAVKFARPEEMLSLRIGAETTDASWVVSVSDNGIGFPDQSKHRIFSVFQRLPGTEDIAGTGIGLANCRKIARMHRGDAWAESTPGQGSTFYFSIATTESSSATGPSDASGPTKVASPEVESRALAETASRH